MNINTTETDSYIHFICGVVCISILFYTCTRNSAKYMITKIGYNERFSLKYVKPNRFIKKHFNIKENHIPRFLYFEFWFALIFIVLLIIEFILYAFVNLFPDLLIPLFILIIAQPIIGIINLVWLFIPYFIYLDSFKKIKNKFKKKEKN